MSDDKGGEAAGVARQEADGRQHAERLGWKVGPDATHVIIENDTSAFKRKKIQLPDGSIALRTVRPGFRRGLEMLASGQGDGLLAYDLDRVARDPRDLEDLIDVVESHHHRIPVESVSGSLRLANDADVTMARVMVAVANKSSRDTARRVTRKHEELAEQGLPGGGGIRPFGYEPDGVTIRESEAAVIRDMASQVLDDVSLNALAGRLNAQGVRPVKAKQWGDRSVWSVLTGPRIAGLRRFRGVVVGAATWDAILDRDTWEAVREKISGRGRGHGNQFVRWLTGTLWCGPCGHVLAGAAATKRVGARYWCPTPKGGCGKIAVGAARVEPLVGERLVEFLSDPQVAKRMLNATTDHSAQDLRRQLAEDEDQMKTLARMWATRGITLAEYSEARSIIEERIKSVRTFALGSAPRVLRHLLAGDVQAGWGALSPSDRRVIALAVVPKGFSVHPHERQFGNKFQPDRIVLR